MPNPYDDVASSLFGGQIALGARASVTSVADRNPDTEAEVQRKARALSVPYDSARAHPEVIDQHIAGAAVDYDNLARTAPRTSKFLSSTSNAAIAHDDIGVLGLLEKGLRLFASPIGVAAFQGAKEADAEIKQKGGPQQWLAAVGRDVSPESIGKHFVKGSMQMVSSLLGLVEGSQEAAEKVDVTTGLQQKLFGGTIESGLAGLSRAARRKIDEKAYAVAPKAPETQIGAGVQSGIESVPISLGALATTIATDGVAPGLALIGGTTYGQSYGQARDEGFGVGRASAKSAIDAVVEMATEYLPEKFFLGDAHAGASLRKMITDQLLAEVPGEQAATLLQDFNQWAMLDANRGKSFDDYAAEIAPHAFQTLVATATGLAGPLAIGGIVKGVGKVVNREAQAKQADAIASQVEEFSKLAKTSKLRERAPETFQSLVADMAEGSEVEDVYVAPDKLGEALFQGGFDEEQSKAVDNLFGPRIKEALEQGTDVKVPIADFATYLAGTPAEKAILDHLKVDPNGMTRAEAEEFMQSQGDQLKQEIEQHLAKASEDDVHQSDLQKVRDQIAGQLQEANRFTQKVNDRYADLQAAFYSVLSKRINVSPNTLYERFPLRIVNRQMSDSHFEQRFNDLMASFGKPPKQGALANDNSAIKLKGPAGERFAALEPAHTKYQTGDVLTFNGEAGRVIAANDKAVTLRLPSGPQIVSRDHPDLKVAPLSAWAEEYHQSETAPIFYSELERAIEKTSQAKASPEQWLATLSKTPGVKKEEIEWTELPEWLATQDGPVTREELLAFVREGGVQVEEVTRGSDSDAVGVHLVEVERDENGDVTEWGLARDDDGEIIEYFDDLDDAQEMLAYRNEEAQGTGQFESYTEEGGEDYHELLLTLPPGVRGNPERAPSTHFDEPGVVAHLRFKTRSTTDGKKLLFIEEVQSDWHQKGRDQGYAAKASDEEVSRLEKAAKEAQEALGSAEIKLINLAIDLGIPVRLGHFTQVSEARRFLDQKTLETVDDLEALLEGTANTSPENRDMNQRIAAALTEEGDARLRYSEAARDFHNARSPHGIPDAPFKATWPALVMKRAIRWAVDNGFEAVAWTTGEQQRERYNLAHTIHEIEVQKRGSEYRVRFPEVGHLHSAIVEKGFGRPEGGEAGIRMSAEQIAEVFGKDLGTRMMALADQATDERTMSLVADDLKIGGEGMLAFYDRNLVNITNNILKKLGGSKVEMLPVEGMVEDLPGVWTARTEFKAIRDGEFGGVTDMVDVPTFAGHWQEMAERHAGTPQGEEYAAYAERLRNATEEDFKRVKDAEQRVRDAESQGSNPGFVITPEIAAHAREGFALFQKNRGAYSPATDTISLLEHADLSTFLHESGHFFLETYSRLVEQGNAPQQITDDFNALLKWFGVKDVATWQSMGLEERREAHEKFARGFEAYLFTGKAPAPRLRDLFRTFRAWLIAVYRHVRNLGVTPTEQIRKVMDRMLATDEEIADAQAARSMEPLFKDQASSGMSEDQWRDYQKTNATATEEAAQQLGSRSLRDLKWLDSARSKEINRLKRQADSIRKVTKARVAAEVANEPVYRAQQYLKRGILDGEQAEGPHKLSIASVTQALTGNPDLDAIKRKLGYGQYGILAEEGLDAEATAQVFGFSSADHLIQSLVNAEPMKDRIAGLTEQRLLEENGDLTDPQSIEEAASEAVHNEFRARAVAAELAALAKATGKPRLLAQAARQFAEDTVARTRVRDLKPAKYEAAASRAARAALEALGKGDLTQAALEKRNQLFNLYATRGARKAQDEVQKALNLFDRLTRPATAKSIEPSYRDQIVQLLDRYDLNRGTTLKAIDKRTSLADWVERQREQGLDPVVPDELLNDTAKRSYKSLTIEELRGLVDTVRNIEHLGRLKSKLLTAKKDRDFQAAVERAASTIQNFAVGFRRPKIERNTWADRAKAGVFDYLALHRKFASLIRQMDGFKDGGPLWELFVRPMNAAGDKETTMRSQATQKLIDVMQPLVKENLTRKLYVPEIDNSLSLEGRLAVALNMGNEINRARLRDGDGWTDEQIDAIGATLTAEQWAVVQQIWDAINSYWPEIAAKERRVTGIEPERVEGDPFQIATADGQSLQLPGGYYPIKYDLDRSTRSEADDQAEIAKAMLRGAYTRASTKRGHTKARVDVVKRPIRKDIGVIGQHLTEVIHDLSWHEYLIDANRLLGSSMVDTAIRDHYGPEVLRAMRNTIADVAAGEIPAKNSFERAVNWLRTGATIAGMAWSFTTSLLQPLGLAQSVKRIGFKYVARGMGRWLGDAAHLQNTVKWITEQSPMMAQRANTLNREINEIRNTVAKSKAGAVNEAVKASFFYLLAKLQLVADVPTWIGQYQKSIEAGEDHERAVALADQAVLDSQGGGQLKDQAGIQRAGGPLLKVWTNFYSYFSVTYNLAAESVGETRLVGPERLPLLAADFLLLFVVPAAMQSLMFSVGRGDDKDWPEIAKEMGINALMAFPQSMVGIRDIAAAISGDERSQAPAGIVGRQFYKFGVQVQQGELDEAFWKSLNQVGGVIFHYPAAQVQRTALGINALANGDTHNPMAVLLGPPQQAKKHKRY